MSEQRTTWVQPILVDRTGTHESTVAAVAVAATAAWLDRSPADEVAWSTWLSGLFTKSVRRLASPRLDGAAGALGGSLVEVGTSRALALRPYRMSDLPREVARAQVAGTDFAREPRTGAVSGPVRLLVLGSLSTGKASAQAAHALMAWAIEADESSVRGVVAAPHRLEVSMVSAQELADAAASGLVVIRDAGLTEVVPGTLTAVAVATGA